MNQKLWQKPYDLDQRIETFTVGQDRELDLRLAPFDILGSLAHGRMLADIGLLTEEEYQQIAQQLRQLFRQAETGDLQIEAGIEDIHSQVELILTRELGDIGKKIHSGRSRNDQVLLDLRLFFRASIQELMIDANRLALTLLERSEQHQADLMPGYTHLQVAMVSSFGLWFGAYAESLRDDMVLWQGVYRIVNQNPLGSAAGYGSSFPLDRQRTTELLGFDDLAYNVVHAQLGRGKTELQLAFALAGMAQTIGKLAMDVCLYNSQNFKFIRLPDEFTTGSSIMPHKKNPDVFELIRGRCALLTSLPAQISQLIGNLPSGYHRDFQLLKEVLFPGIDQLKELLSLTNYAIGSLEVLPDLLKNEEYRMLFTVEVVNAQVLAGMPFRDAYHAVATQIAEGTFEPPTDVKHTHLGSLGNLATEAIREKLESTFHEFRFTEGAAALEALLAED